MDAVLVSHNGIGDSLYMIGALHYLSYFYKKIYFICKSKYYDNVKLFFINTNIQCISFNLNYVNYSFNDELLEIIKIINKFKKRNTDVFICGMFNKYIKSRINNVYFLNKIHNTRKKYNIDYDTLTSNNYSFIEKFYKDIYLNLNIFYDYFKLPQTQESIELYNTVKDYYIIFIQLKSSCGKSLNITRILNKYLFDKNTIILCNDVNLYNNISDKNNNIEDNISHKRAIAERFVFNKIIYYYDTIINSDEIYIIDSCFIGIVLPLLKLKKLKTNKVRIILRDISHKILL